MLTNQLPENITYHSADHTNDVVKAALEICNKSEFSEENMEILELAALFHDLGFTEAIDNHEDCSARLALDFFNENSFDNNKSARVVGCIMATKMPQSPKNIVEEALCDADLLHLATDKYFEKAKLLHGEMEIVKGTKITEKEWMEMNRSFIKSHEFFTPYARENYGPKQNENLKKVEKKLKKMKQEKEVAKLRQKVEDLKMKVIDAKEQKPTRGIETMFRLTSKNHLDLSAMADNKANIMISINAIILSVLVSVLVRKLEEYPYLTIPTLIMTGVCLITIVLSILATRPNVSRGKFNKKDILNKKTNLLFFGNFHSMNRDDYEWGMKEMMKDADYLYSSLIRDIYYLGVVLGKKYRLLRFSYTIFMFGFVISVISFLIAQMFFKSAYPY
ncbi:MAG: DUF5706 domain-containing protein [Bacteroidetes bacterium]|nr:DUF5706 domain-containing protein [Bacteroidota bacterium]